MTKRASTRESLVLAFELLKRIPRSRKVTASEHNEELEHAGIAREIRTIQRNLEILCEHFEIERDDRTKPYGYSLKLNIDGLALPTLIPQESLLFVLAEDYLSNFLPQSSMISMQSYFRETRHNLRSVTESSKERAWLKKVRFVVDAQPLLPPEIEPDIFHAVSEALFHDRFLTVEYTNANHRANAALVMPLGLVQQSNRIYLVFRFDGFDNERSLTLHRITKATVTDSLLLKRWLMAFGYKINSIRFDNRELDLTNSNIN